MLIWSFASDFKDISAIITINNAINGQRLFHSSRGVATGKGESERPPPKGMAQGMNNGNDEPFLMEN